MSTRRLHLVGVIGLGLAVSTAGCSMSGTPVTTPDGGVRDGASGSGGRQTGSGGAMGSGGAAGAQGSGGAQAPRSENWFYGTWIGTWPDTTDGTAPSQFAGKQVKVVINRTDTAVSGVWKGYNYKGEFTWDAGGAGEWKLALQLPNTTVAEELINYTYAWWLWSPTSEQCTIQGHKDNSNHVRLTTSTIGARGITPPSLDLNWELIVDGVTESNGRGVGPKLTLVKQP